MDNCKVFFLEFLIKTAFFLSSGDKEDFFKAYRNTKNSRFILCGDVLLRHSTIIHF